MLVKSSTELKLTQVYNGNLPIPLASFIGRDSEIAHIRGLLASSRLVTLTGLGGSGKTRLALEVATEVRAGYRDGAWWVDLAPLTAKTFVPQVIAQALEVYDVPSQPLTQRLVHFLRDKNLLLV